MLQPAESSWIEPYVVALYRPTVQLATLLVRDYTVAQDIVQEAFVRVWLSPRTPREMSALRPWLYKTVVNLARDHQRRQGRWARLRFGRASSADPMDVAEGREEDAVLGHATTRRVAMPLGSPGHAAPLPFAALPPLLAAAVIVVALGLWLAGRRRARQSQAGVIWID